MRKTTANSQNPRTAAKRLAVLLLVMVLSLSLCGCIYRYYDFEDIHEQVIDAIEFYDFSGAPELCRRKL